MNSIPKRIRKLIDESISYYLSPDEQAEVVEWMNALPQEPEAPAVDWSKVPEVMSPDEYNQDTWGE
jgi:hypothetical protein